MGACEKTLEDPISNDNNPPEIATNKTILDSITVLSIVFDTKGTAWIGTLSQGLVEYGLKHTKIYNSSNSPLTNSPIWDIAVDNKNNVWIGSDGLVKFDGAEFTTYNTTNSDIPEDVVWSVAADSKDNIWVASSRFKRGGLAKFNGVNFKTFTPQNSPLPVNMTNAIAIDKHDNVWVSASQTVNEAYLIKITGDSWTVYDSDDFNRKLYWIRDIQINSKNQVCGAIDYSLHGSSSGNPNVFCFDGNKMNTYTLDGVRNGFQSIMVDKNDNFWCTFGNGYAYYDGIRWSRTNSETIEKNGVSYYKNAFFTIEQSPNGNVWIGKDTGIEIIKND